MASHEENGWEGRRLIGAGEKTSDEKRQLKQLCIQSNIKRAKFQSSKKSTWVGQSVSPTFVAETPVFPSRFLAASLLTCSKSGGVF